MNGAPVYWLSPTHRLLHNMLHATLPYGEFIRSEIKLSDLAECAAIALRYGEEIHYQDLWHLLSEHGLASELSVCAMLAHTFMHANICYPQKRFTRLHANRLVALNDLSVGDNQLGTNLMRKLAKAYYYLKMPGWVYRNACYGNDQTRVGMRLRFILKRVLDPSSRKKVIQNKPKTSLKLISLNL